MAGHPFGKIDGIELRWQHIGVCSGQEEKGLDDLPEVADLALHQVQDTAVFLDGSLLSQGQLDLALHCRQGGAKLVRGVPGELLLSHV